MRDFSTGGEPSVVTEATVEARKKPEQEVPKEIFKEMLQFVRFFHASNYARFQEILHFTIEDLDQLPKRGEHEDAKSLALKLPETPGEKVLAAFDAIRLFDEKGKKFKLFKRIRKIKKYKKILRHDMPTATIGVYSIAEELRQDFSEDLADPKEVLDSIQAFVRDWPRFYIGIEHLTIHALDDEEMSDVFKEAIDTRTVLDATLFWAENSGVAIRKGKKTKEFVNSKGKKIKGKDETLTMFKGLVNIDESFRKLMDTDEEYEGNTGMLGHAIRSCINNAVKSLAQGAEVTTYAEKDEATEDLIITIADKGCGMTQEQLNPDPDSTTYIFNAGVSEDKGEGIGLAGLDKDFKRFKMDMQIYTLGGLYPNPDKVVSEVQQSQIDAQLRKYPVGKNKESASTIFQFRLHKKTS